MTNDRLESIILENLHKLDEGKKSRGNKASKKGKNRGQIEKYFKKKGVNCAPYAYKLFHVKTKDGKDSKEMKNARSLFMKKLNHETNDYGNPYKFTSGELNRLQSLISNAQLSEAVDRAFKTVLNEDVEEEGWLRDKWNGLKGAVQGAKMGYNQAQYSGQANGNLNNNGPVTGMFDKMVASVKNSQDAATVYGKLMKTAAQYAEKAKQLRAKIKEIGASHDVVSKQNRVGNKFASGFKRTDTGTTHNMRFQGDRAAADMADRNLQFGKTISNPGANGALNEAIERALYETLIEEGLWNNLKGAWQGMKTGAQVGTALGSDAKADYGNEAQVNRFNNTNNSVFGRMKDAKSSIQKYYELAKQYDNIALNLRTQAKALKEKWGIVRNNVGQTDTASYGYSKKQPQAQPDAQPMMEEDVLTGKVS